MMKTYTALQRRNRRVLFPSLLLCLSLPLTQHSSAAILPGDLLITEVMANPAAVSDTAGEWFEVFNNSHSDIDLDGLVIKDNGSNEHTVNNGGALWLGSGEYFVFGRSGDSLVNGGYEVGYAYNNFTLGNSSDAIILESLNLVVASLVYSGSPWGAAGNSVEWTGTMFDLTPDNFMFGDGDIGTPGFQGSEELMSAVPIPAAGWLMGSALSTLLFARRRKHCR